MDGAFAQRLSLQKCRNMADEIASLVTLDRAVYEALATTQREIFVKGFSRYAYTLDALPLLKNQWISSPLTVAKMTMALCTNGADNVLEIGCGSGYQAAILSKLIRRVFTIERIETLLNDAKDAFKQLNLTIHTRFDDGMRGWRDYAPFDRILLSATISNIPDLLFEQLSMNGILVAPILNNDKQVITRYTKTPNGIHEEMLGECYFVPIKEGTLK